MIARETPDLNIFTEPTDRFVNDVGDLFVRILDKSLFEQTGFGVEALYFTLDNLIDDLFRLAGFQRLLAIDRLFFVEFRPPALLRGANSADSPPLPAWRYL